MNQIILPSEHYIKKQAEELLAKGIEKIYAFFGINHTGWYVLHYASEKPFIKKNDLTLKLISYADANVINNIVIKFKIEGVIYNVEDKITLTTNGLQLYKNCLEQLELFKKNMDENYVDRKLFWKKDSQENQLNKAVE